ncbi:MAG: hypothetical protein AAGM84_17190 [Pseudomonadota bacterium]
MDNAWEDSTTELSHPASGRHRVDVGEKGRSKFRAFDDTAMDAAMQVAELAEVKTTGLVAQRLQVTAFTITITGATIAFYANDDGAALSGFSPLLFAFYVLFGIGSGLATAQIGASEAYYYKLGSTLTYLHRKHFRIGKGHKDADEEYQDATRRAPGLLDQHAYRPFVVINALTPIIGGLFVLL